MEDCTGSKARTQQLEEVLSAIRDPSHGLIESPWSLERSGPGTVLHASDSNHMRKESNGVNSSDLCYVAAVEHAIQGRAHNYLTTKHIHLASRSE